MTRELTLDCSRRRGLLLTKDAAGNWEDNGLIVACSTCREQQPEVQETFHPTEDALVCVGCGKPYPFDNNADPDRCVHCLWPVWTARIEVVRLVRAHSRTVRH